MPVMFWGGQILFRYGELAMDQRAAVVQTLAVVQIGQWRLEGIRHYQI